MSPDVTETVEGAEPTPETPEWATDALDALIGDDYSDAESEPTEEVPPTGLDSEHGDADPTETGDDPTPADAGEDDEPEALKDILKGLTRSQKGTVLQHYRGLAEQRHQAAAEIEDRNRADAAAREAQAAEIRSKRGAYIGEVEGKREDGTPIPTFSELERLLTTPGGDDVLDDRYGLSVREAQDQLQVWRDARSMLDGSLDDFRTEAWVEGGRKLAGSVASAGLPIDAIWKDVKGIEDVVPSVVAHLKAEHAAEIASLKKEHDSRLKAATANGTAQAARTAARTLPQPETGGRGDAGGARIYLTSELDDLDFFKAHEADIDRAYAEGRIRPG